MMQSDARILFVAKLLLPIIVLFSLRATPVPRDVSDGLSRFRLAQQRERHDAAAQALRKVVESEPWRIYLWEQIAVEDFAAARFQEAVAAFEIARESGELSPEGCFRLAEAYIITGKQTEAEAVWQAILGQSDLINSDLRSQVYGRMAQIQRERGDFNAAVITLRAWLEAEPSNPFVSFLLGLHLAVVQPGEAIPYLVAAAQADPVYSPVVQKIRRGLNLASEGDSPGYNWMMIGRALGSAGQWDLAVEAFRLATVAAPQYAEAWAFLAEAYYQTGSSSKDALEQAVALDPQSVVVRSLVALNYRRQGNPDQALMFLEEVAGQEPEEPVWQVELANIQVERSDLQAALTHYINAVLLAPANTDYWQHLARFSIEYNMSVDEIGLPAARKAVVLAPEDPAALDLMGWALVYRSDFDSAERFLQQAVEKDASYAPAQLHLGQLYIQEGDMDRAYAYLKRAAELSGQNAVGMIARRLLRQYYAEGN